METAYGTAGPGSKRRFVLGRRARFALGAVLMLALLGSIGWIVLGWPLPTRLWIVLVLAAGCSFSGIIALFIRKELPDYLTRAFAGGTGLMVLIAAVMTVQGAGSPVASNGRQGGSPPTLIKPPASPEELTDTLLTPPELSHLGRLVVTDQQSGAGIDVTSSDMMPDITYISGDPECRNFLEGHELDPLAWASVYMVDKPKEPETVVNEEIHSYANLAETQQVMVQNREQVANCSTFFGDYTGRMKFRHKQISIPPLGDELVAHQMIGEDEDTWIMWNFVEIRSGMDIIFINHSPSAESGVAHIADISSAAWIKYSTVRR